MCFRCVMFYKWYSTVNSKKEFSAVRAQLHNTRDVNKLQAMQETFVHYVTCKFHTKHICACQSYSFTYFIKLVIVQSWCTKEISLIFVSLNKRTRVLPFIILFACCLSSQMVTLSTHRVHLSTSKISFLWSGMWIIWPSPCIPTQQIRAEREESKWDFKLALKKTNVPTFL